MRTKGTYFSFKRDGNRLTTTLKNHWTLEVANHYYQSLERYFNRHDIEILIVKTEDGFSYDSEIIEIKEQYPELEAKHGVSQVFYIDKAKELYQPVTTHYVPDEKAVKEILANQP